MIAQQGSHTAEVAAFSRALQQQLPPRQRILDDPWAMSLALSGFRWTARFPYFARCCLRMWPRMVDCISTRDRFADETVDTVVSRNGHQVVILGAGLDTLTYRTLARYPNCQVFEIDHPDTQAVKLHRLEGQKLPQSDAIHYVAANLEVQEFLPRLIAAGFRIDRPSAFIWMGVTYYLSREAVCKTLTAIRGSMAPGSMLAFDFWPPELTFAPTDAKLKARKEWFDRLGEPLSFGIEVETLPEFLQENGFRVARQGSLRGLGWAYSGRDMHVPDGLSVVAAECAPVPARLPVDPFEVRDFQRVGTLVESRN